MSTDSLGDDAAEERHVELEVLWQVVQTAHGSEVNQTVGGLLTVLNWNTSCEDQETVTMTKMLRLSRWCDSNVRCAAPVVLI